MCQDRWMRSSIGCFDFPAKAVTVWGGLGQAIEIQLEARVELISAILIDRFWASS